MKSWKSIAAVGVAALIAGCRTSNTISAPLVHPPLLMAPDHIDVVIDGVSCFYLADPGNPVLLIVKDPGGLHQPTVRLPPTDRTQLKAALQEKDCTAGCRLASVGLRITDGGQAFTGPMTVDPAVQATFDTAVTHLQRDIDPSFRNFDDFTDAGKKATKPPKAASKVHAYLDLRGGEVVAVTPFACKGTSAPNACGVTVQSRPWAQSVTVRFKTANPQLAVVQASGSDLPVSFIDFDGTGVKISNVTKPPGGGSLPMSHMHLFAGLTSDTVCLPEVQSTAECTGSGKTSPDFVPGCGNTQWP